MHVFSQVPIRYSFILFIFLFIYLFIYIFFLLLLYLINIHKLY